MKIRALMFFLMLGLWIASIAFVFFQTRKHTLDNLDKHGDSPLAREIRRIKALEKELLQASTRSLPYSARVAETYSPTLSINEQLAVANEIPHLFERHIALLDIAARLKLHQVPEALSFYESMPIGQNSENFLHAILYRWAKINPEKSLAYAEELSAMDGELAHVSGALRGWASSDPMGAWSWLAENSSNDPNDIRVFGVIGGITEDNPELVFDLLKKLKKTEEQERISKMIIWHFMYNQREEEIATWLTQLPNGTLKDIASNQFIAQKAKIDPDAAYQWLLSYNTQSPGKNSVPFQLTTAWSSVQPFEATQWLLDIVKDPNQKLPEDWADAMGIVAQSWVKSDPVGVGNWLNDKEPSPDLDILTEELAYEILKNDPEGAALWAIGIDTPELRKSVLQDISYFWADLDANELLNFIDTSDLPQEDKLDLQDALVILETNTPQIEHLEPTNHHFSLKAFELYMAQIRTVINDISVAAELDDQLRNTLIQEVGTELSTNIYAEEVEAATQVEKTQ